MSESNKISINQSIKQSINHVFIKENVSSSSHFVYLWIIICILKYKCITIIKMAFQQSRKHSWSFQQQQNFLCPFPRNPVTNGMIYLIRFLVITQLASNKQMLESMLAFFNAVWFSYAVFQDIRLLINALNVLIKFALSKPTFLTCSYHVAKIHFQ